MLIDAEALPAIIHLVRPEDFYKGAHQRIFEAVLALFDRGQSIDLITLTEELRARGVLELCGGPPYVSRLTSAVPTSANVEFYARIVQAASIRRTLARVSQEIIAAAHDDGSDISVILEEAERRIFEISDRHQTGTYYPAKEIVKLTFDAIEKHYHSKTEYTGIPSGFKDLDQLTMGFQNSEFIVIGARPSVGKTAFALTSPPTWPSSRRSPSGSSPWKCRPWRSCSGCSPWRRGWIRSACAPGCSSPADFSRITDACSRLYEAPMYISDSPT